MHVFQFTIRILFARSMNEYWTLHFMNFIRDFQIQLKLAEKWLYSTPMKRQIDNSTLHIHRSHLLPQLLQQDGLLLLRYINQRTPLLKQFCKFYLNWLKFHNITLTKRPHLHSGALSVGRGKQNARGNEVQHLVGTRYSFRKHTWYILEGRVT